MMLVTNEVHLSECLRSRRFSAEFFDPKYVFTPKHPTTWIKIGRTLSRCEYGLSIPMNSDGRGVPILRMNEIEDCLVLEPAKFAPVSEEEHTVFRMKRGDVLFNRTNSFEFVGRTGIVTNETDAVFASYLVRAVTNKEFLLPEVLAVYLNTDFGIGQIKRRAMRSINQANVSASELKQILIPLFEPSVQHGIADDVQNAAASRQAATSFFSAAQALLDRELGLDRLKFENPFSYEARFSEATSSHRLDAQHFRPRFRRLFEHIRSMDHVQVGAVAEKNERGVQPVYVEGGDFDVVNSQHLGRQHLNYEGFEKTSEEEFRRYPEAHIRYGDVLIYTTGAYIGRTNVFLRETPALASNHVHILRLRGGMDTAYVALALSAIVGSYQTEKHARGSAQAELYPSDIAKFILPVISQEKQREIGDLVRSSLAAQDESRRLLEQAKRRVEELIEEAIER